jgi:hypothetical protein
VMACVLICVALGVCQQSSLHDGGPPDASPDPDVLTSSDEDREVASTDVTRVPAGTVRKPEARSSADIHVRPGVVDLLIVVEREEDAGPLAGASVTLAWGDTWGFQSSRRCSVTTGDGECLFSGFVRDGDRVVATVSAPGRERHQQLARVAVRGTGMQRQQRLTFVLPRAGTISGTVVGTDGRPLAGATLRLSDSPRVQVDSDMEGFFRFEHLPLFSSHTVELVSSTRRVLHRVDAGSGASGYELPVVRLTAMHRHQSISLHVFDRVEVRAEVRVRLLDADGTPILDGWVTARSGSSEIRRGVGQGESEFLLEPG